jgi:hypothetical protein
MSANAIGSGPEMLIPLVHAVSGHRPLLQDVARASTSKPSTSGLPTSIILRSAPRLRHASPCSSPTLVCPRSRRGTFRREARGVRGVGFVVSVDATKRIWLRGSSHRRRQRSARGAERALALGSEVPNDTRCWIGAAWPTPRARYWEISAAAWGTARATRTIACRDASPFQQRRRWCSREHASRAPAAGARPRERTAAQPLRPHRQQVVP